MMLIPDITKRGDVFRPIHCEALKGDGFHFGGKLFAHTLAFADSTHTAYELPYSPLLTEG
ncbi:hypothetical protein Pcaca03_13880 [Pectobacterium carotovorum subsp. carotovorum]|uniref:Uncharacterized protein n=1 Tax=Pectobacterium carotovorum subsp. carotovorum TaxID=555 RepID=A0AAI9PCZ9_PECCC|nr:hypothetical protein SOASR016_10350 [Pectobacterium carotovorum subsp. carotovorum]GLV68944.1 hypothetical protein Pcaca03_13880 [Pectobacterium carotovorum subsp. carotovorum]